LGADLSENSIAEVSKETNDTLHFKVHDMRAPLKKKMPLFNELPVLLFEKRRG
jgi:hypothetical protein